MRMSGVPCLERYWGTGAPCILEGGHLGPHDNTFEQWRTGEPPPDLPAVVCDKGHGLPSEAELEGHVYVHRWHAGEEEEA